MSVSDHESLHVEFIIEMKKVGEQAGQTRTNYAPRYTKKRTYYPTDRSGLSYGDLLNNKEEGSVMQDPYSEYGTYTSQIPEEKVNSTSRKTMKISNSVNIIESDHEFGSDIMEPNP